MTATQTTARARISSVSVTSLALLAWSLGACGGDESRPSNLPTGEVVRIELSPPAMLLTDDLNEGELHIRAFDEQGNEVQAAGIEVEWTSTDDNEVAVVPVGAGRATVSRVDEVGSTVVVARVVGREELVSNPVVVHSALLHDEVVLLEDRNIVFPPLGDVDSEVDLLAQPGFRQLDGETYVGEFPLLGLFAALTVSEDEDQPKLRYPVVIRREAYVEGMTRLLGSEGAQVYGEVIDHAIRGDLVALLVEASSPTEIYEAIDVEFDGEALAEQGLLNLEEYQNELAEVMAQDEEDGFRGFGGLFSQWDDPSCVSGDWSILSLEDVNLTLKPKLLPPVYQIKMKGFGIDVLELKHGFGVEALFRPHFDVQFSGESSIDCYVGHGLDFTIPTPLFGLPIGVGVAQNPKVKLGVSGGAGPRINAYFLKRCDWLAHYGFRWEDGGLHGQDAGGEDYNRVTNTCFNGENDFDANLTVSTFADFNPVHDVHLDLDAFLEAHMGVAFEQSFSLRPLGGALTKLENAIKHASLKQDILDVESQVIFGDQDALAGNILEHLLNGTWLNILKSLTDLRLLRIEAGLGLNGIFSSPLRLLNNADKGTYHANENQALGLQLTAEAEAGFLELGDWIGALVPHANFEIPSITVEPPPLDLIPIYRGIEGYGDMVFSATKGPGNTGYELELGDTIHLDIPGVYGGWTLVPHALLPEGEVFGGEVVWRTSLIDFQHAGSMAVSFVEGGNTMRFKADIELVDPDFVEYLNYAPPEGAFDDNELFFLSYNQLWLGSPSSVVLPGYLGSMDDFALVQVEIEGIPESIELSAKSAEQDSAQFEIQNKSKFLDDFFPVDMKDIYVAELPSWLSVNPSFASFSVEGQGELISLTGTCPAVPEPTTFTHALDLQFGHFDAEQGQYTFEESYTVEIELECLPPDTPDGPLGPPTFVGTLCPATASGVDYAALDAELAFYQDQGSLQFGVKLPAASLTCPAMMQVELPVGCFDTDGMNYHLWKMGGSASFNDFGILGTPYYVWNPQYMLEGMWEQLGLIFTEPVSLLSYAQETNPLVPCNDARGDLNSGPASPIINNAPVGKLTAYPVHTRSQPDPSLPEGFQSCYDLLTLYSGNDLAPCSAATASGNLYMVIEAAEPF